MYALGAYFHFPMFPQHVRVRYQGLAVKIVNHNSGRYGLEVWIDHG
jgi:hypothetical protein